MAKKIDPEEVDRIVLQGLIAFKKSIYKRYDPLYVTPGMYSITTAQLFKRLRLVEHPPDKWTWSYQQLLNSLNRISTKGNVVRSNGYGAGPTWRYVGK